MEALKGDMIIPDNTVRDSLLCPGGDELTSSERRRQNVPAHEMGHILGQMFHSPGLMDPDTASTELGKVDTKKQGTVDQKKRFKDNAKKNM